MNNSEKLKHPKWQKKRLEIMQRDDWRCKHCGNPNNTLHVHHLKYKKGKDPWDYPDDNFITLCEKCHKYYHASYGSIDTVSIEKTLNVVSDILKKCPQPGIDNEVSVNIYKEHDDFTEDNHFIADIFSSKITEETTAATEKDPYR